MGEFDGNYGVKAKLLACAHEDRSPWISSTVGTAHVSSGIVANHVDPAANFQLSLGRCSMKCNVIILESCFHLGCQFWDLWHDNLEPSITVWPQYGSEKCRSSQSHHAGPAATKASVPLGIAQHRVCRTPDVPKAGLAAGCIEGISSCIQWFSNRSSAVQWSKHLSPSWTSSGLRPKGFHSAWCARAIGFFVVLHQGETDQNWNGTLESTLMHWGFAMICRIYCASLKVKNPGDGGILTSSRHWAAPFFDTAME